MANAPRKISTLDVSINGVGSGQLSKDSTYEFHYASRDVVQPSLGLMMPAREKSTWQDGALFPVMDQHLPEGDLLLRLSMKCPAQQLQPVQLLALIGDNGIGRLGYVALGAKPAPAPLHVDRRSILSMSFTQETFDDLVTTHLITGAGIAGVQPKIMLADRVGSAVPTVIVKTAPPAYPGLVANEFLCMSAAQRAGMRTPEFELSHDGNALVVDRFDLATRQDGRVERLGFEDIASLMGLRVRDTLAVRKYRGSYQRIAELLRRLQVGVDDLHQFFEQVALSVMVRNGDAHLKNYGVLVPEAGPPRLSPVFDVVTTAVYTYTRFFGDAEQTDRTMALKLFAGRHQTKAYPTTEELLRFGSEVCGVPQPRAVLARIAQAMQETMTDARADSRIPTSLRARMEPLWHLGMQYASNLA